MLNAKWVGNRHRSVAFLHTTPDRAPYPPLSSSVLKQHKLHVSLLSSVVLFVLPERLTGLLAYDSAARRQWHSGGDLADQLAVEDRSGFLCCLSRPVQVSFGTGHMGDYFGTFGWWSICYQFASHGIAQQFWPTVN